MFISNYGMHFDVYISTLPTIYSRVCENLIEQHEESR